MGHVWFLLHLFANDNILYTLHCVSSRKGIIVKVYFIILELGNLFGQSACTFMTHRHTRRYPSTHKHTPSYLDPIPLNNGQWGICTLYFASC